MSNWSVIFLSYLSTVFEKLAKFFRRWCARYIIFVVIRQRKISNTFTKTSVKTMDNLQRRQTEILLFDWPVRLFRYIEQIKVSVSSYRNFKRKGNGKLQPCFIVSLGRRGRFSASMYSP